MNKKILWIAGLFVVMAAAVVFFIMMQRRSAGSIPADAKDVVVTDIRRVNVDAHIDSYLSWVPGQENSVAAVVHGFSDGDIVRAYNLETGQSKDLYNLKDYGVGLGNGITFFWSADGKRIVTSSGGVFDLETKVGHWIKPPEGYRRINVDVMSPDGKKLFIDGSGDKVFGLFITDIESEEFHPFDANLDAFSPSLPPAPWKVAFYPLAWSPDGKWFAVETYDPDHPPKTITEEVPGALYLLRVDGQEARLISRNIEGRIDAVTFSPDGNKLIWEETRKGEQYVYIANLDGSGMHEIFSNADLPSEYNITSNLLWSPDGTRIVYAGPPDKNFNYHLWVLTLGKATSITPTP